MVCKRLREGFVGSSGDAAGVDRLLHRRDDEVGADAFHRRVAKIEDLGKVVSGVDVHHGERQLRRPERLLGDVQHHDAVLAAGEEQHRTFELGRDLTQQMHGLRFERVEVRDQSLHRCLRYCGYGCGQPCRPHSDLSCPAQRPARGSSPGFTARVHGQQPIDG